MAQKFTMITLPLSATVEMLLPLRSVTKKGGVGAGSLTRCMVTGAPVGAVLWLVLSPLAATLEVLTVIFGVWWRARATSNPISTPAVPATTASNPTISSDLFMSDQPRLLPLIMSPSRAANKIYPGADTRRRRKRHSSH